MDQDGYPDEKELEQIKTWPHTDFKGLMNFIYDIWKDSDPNLNWCGWKQVGRSYTLHTGGWSGNEEIIEAMSENRIFWTMCWDSSKKGGHFKFIIPREIL